MAAGVEGMWKTEFPPLSMLNVVELMAHGLAGSYDQAVPGEPFETCRVYELAQGAGSLRLILPFASEQCALIWRIRRLRTCARWPTAGPSAYAANGFVRVFDSIGRTWSTPGEDSACEACQAC
jgi:hypothetical protein